MLLDLQNKSSSRSINAVQSCWNARKC